MASYSLDAINKALEAKTKPTQKAKTNYFKPQIGEYDIRFLPLKTEDNVPYVSVSFYTKLSQNRYVAPSTFGMEDPILDFFSEIRKDRNNWNIAKNLKTTERFFVSVMVRSKEKGGKDEGPLVWEISDELRMKFLNILRNKDFVDEDMLDPNTGYDFSLTVTQAIENGKPRMWNGFAIKQYDLLNRRKPSKLASTKEETEKLIQAIPDVVGMFKAMVKPKEELLELLENYMAKSTGPTEGSVAVEQQKSDDSDDVSKKLDEAFSL